MNDDEAHEYYKDPEHLRPAGPWFARLVRPRVRELVYTPPECGPRSKTVNISSLPYWEKNPYYDDHDVEELTWDG